MALDPDYVQKIDMYAMNRDFAGMYSYLNSLPINSVTEPSDNEFDYIDYYMIKLVEYGNYTEEKDWIEYYWHFKRHDRLVDAAIAIAKYHLSEYVFIGILKYGFNSKQLKQFEIIITDKISKGDDEYHCLGLALYGSLFLSMYEDKTGSNLDGKYGYSMDQAYQQMKDHYDYVQTKGISPAYLKKREAKSDWYGDMLDRIEKAISTKNEKHIESFDKEIIGSLMDDKTYRTIIKGIESDPEFLRKVEQHISSLEEPDQKTIELLKRCAKIRVKSAKQISENQTPNGIDVKDLFEIGKTYFELGSDYHFAAKMIFYYATLKGDVESSYYFAYMFDKGLGKRPSCLSDPEIDRISEDFYNKVVRGNITKCGWYYKSAKLGNKKAIEYLDRLVLTGDLEAMLYSGKY